VISKENTTNTTTKVRIWYERAGGMRQYEQYELTIWPIQTQTSNTLTNAQKSLFFLSSMVVEAAAESGTQEFHTNQFNCTGKT
jgi:hypothetical protein